MSDLTEKVVIAEKDITGLLLKKLEKRQNFTLAEAFDVYRSQGGNIIYPSFVRKLNRAVLQGRVIRVGRGCFCVADDLRQPYRWTYSPATVEMVGFLRGKTWNLKMTAFEILQLNEFVNHLLAHNVTFLSVEAECVQSVFELLRGRYAARVLLKPSVEDYFNYWVDDLVIVQPLRPDAPNAGRRHYAAPPEQWLVELFADPVLDGCVGHADRGLVVEGMFKKYILNGQRLARYAKRRGRGDAFKAQLHT